MANWWMCSVAAAFIASQSVLAPANAATGWTGGDPNGLQLELRPSIAVSRTGDLIPYVLTIRDARADSYRLQVFYSDGSAFEYSYETACGAGSSAGSLEEDIDLSHSYRLPGAFSLTVRVDTDGCGAESETGVASATAVTTPGEPRSNGTGAPGMFIDKLRRDPNDHRKVATEVVLSDSDGWPAEISVAWGDGLRTTYKNPARCQDPIVRFPSGRFSVTVAHKYQRDGRYRVQVVGRSTGCDQANVQRNVRGFTALVSS